MESVNDGQMFVALTDVIEDVNDALTANPWKVGDSLCRPVNPENLKAFMREQSGRGTGYDGDIIISFEVWNSGISGFKAYKSLECFINDYFDVTAKLIAWGRVDALKEIRYREDGVTELTCILKDYELSGDLSTFWFKRRSI